MNQPRPRVAGYVHVTAAAAGRPGMSPPEQRERIDFVSAREWELAEVVEDSGVRAAQREGLEELLDRLDGIDKVVVTGLARLGGSVRRLHDALERLDAGGADLVAIDEDIDTASEEGRALRKVLGVVTRWEPEAGRLDRDWQAETLRRRGFAPATVIDVGAGRGTPLLYRVFPDAVHVMIEPLREFEDDLRRIAATRRGAQYLPTAIGAREGTATINVSPDCLLESSLNEVRWREADPAMIAREVPVTTLDDLLAEHGWTGPFAIKIDTEGFEHRVIEGATATLAQTQLVIAEVSVARRFDQSYTFAEFVALMAARGFELCDVLNVVKATDGDVSYMDCAFRRQSPAG